jgi:hypothetical protein
VSTITTAVDVLCAGTAARAVAPPTAAVKIAAAATATRATAVLVLIP